MGAGSDGDGDHLSALVEYAFGKSPQNGGGGYTFSESWNPQGVCTVVLDVIDDPSISVSYEVSNDLQSWLPVTVTSSEAAPAPGFDRETVSFDPEALYESVQPNLFFRASVSKFTAVLESGGHTISNFFT